MTMTDRYRVLVTGGREWKDENPIRLRFAEIIATRGPENVVIIHGACPRGADQLADQIARAWTGLTIERHPADWDHCGPDCPRRPHRVHKKPGDIDHPGLLPDYCPKAGPRRNRLMASFGADICLAFPLPGSYGTQNCIKAARRAGIPVRRYPA